MTQTRTKMRQSKTNDPEHVQEEKNLVLFILNVAAICLLGFIMYKAYFPLINLLPKRHEYIAGMVRTDGTNLMIDDKVFPIIGVNDYDLAFKSNNVIDQTFSTLHKNGVTTVRFWLFGDGEAEGFQPKPGVMNQKRFKQADYIIYEARKYNMKVIPVLVNNWADYGGKDQYIQWINENPAKDETIFYTDDQIKSLFEKYIHYVLSRKNTYTHLIYANDPTILGWDIMNEPRSNDQNSMNKWLISIAVYIKQYDSNHLVFSGTETATITDPKPADTGKSSNLCENSVIDICSVHLYLFNENKLLYATYTDVTNYMQQQAAYAKEFNKPIMLEEFGIAKNTTPFGNTQFPVMKQLLSVSQEDGYAGYLMWDWSDTPDSPFTFSPNGNLYGGYSLSELKQLIH